MQDFIARENIRRFEAQLAECTDEEQKAVLARLLERERLRLQELKRTAAAARRT